MTSENLALLGPMVIVWIRVFSHFRIVFLERLRLKYQIYEFDDKSRNDRMAMLPNVLNRYNVALDEDIKMLLGNKQEIRPDVLRGIAKKLSAW